MSPTLVASNAAGAPSAQWAHDIRNALAVASLHLDTLEMLSGAPGRKAASAAQATLRRAAGLCEASLAEAARPPRRGPFDLMSVVREVTSLLSGVAPAHLTIYIPAEQRCMVAGDATDLYRTIFNLVQNAVTAARQGAAMTELRIDIVRDNAVVVVTIADDGPGLPARVRSALFRRHDESKSSGFGIAIARELAERNGARLTLETTALGTCYRLELMPAAAGGLAAVV